MRVEMKRGNGEGRDNGGSSFKCISRSLDNRRPS